MFVRDDLYARLIFTNRTFSVPLLFFGVPEQYGSDRGEVNARSLLCVSTDPFIVKSES